MTTFLWTLLFLLAVETIGRLFWLCREPPPRTKLEVAVDLAAGIGLLMWVAVLLERS